MNTSQDTERTYREAPVVREPRRNNNWLPLLLLLPLLFIGGYLLGNSMDNNREQTEVTASTSPRFGVGGGPGDPVVTPLPEDDEMINEEELTSPTMEEEMTEDEMMEEEEATASPSSSPQTGSPSATFQRTGEESSI